MSRYRRPAVPLFGAIWPRPFIPNVVAFGAGCSQRQGPIYATFGVRFRVKKGISSGALTNYRRPGRFRAHMRYDGLFKSASIGDASLFSIGARYLGVGFTSRHRDGVIRSLERPCLKAWLKGGFFWVFGACCYHRQCPIYVIGVAFPISALARGIWLSVLLSDVGLALSVLYKGPARKHYSKAEDLTLTISNFLM